MLPLNTIEKAMKQVCKDYIKGEDKMTIYEIKQRTKKTAPYYFSRDTMRFFGQTLKDFSVIKQKDGRYRICALNKNAPTANDFTVRYFNPINDKLEPK